MWGISVGECQMKGIAPPVDPPPRASRLHIVVGQVRVFARQVQQALGVRGVVAATAAGVVSLTCGAVAFVVIATSLQPSNIARIRQQAARAIELDQSYQALTRSILAMGTGLVQVQEGRIAIQGAWLRLTERMTAHCAPDNKTSPFPEDQLALCASLAQNGERIGTELQLLAPPARRMAPAIAGDLMAMGQGITNLGRQLIELASDDTERMSRHYRQAIFVLTLSTAGFVSAGLVLIFLVGRVAAQAVDARDLLDETIESLPAGVVLYDPEDRLLLFNSMAASATPRLNATGVIGTTYAALVRESAKNREAAGLGPQDAWVAEQLARFASKGDRGIRQLADGRWFEMYEKATPTGHTIGLRVDVTARMNHEIEIERSRAEYQSLVASLSDVVFTIDVEGLFVFVSPSAVDLFGVPPESLIGARFGAYILPEDRHLLRGVARDLRQLMPGTAHQVQFRLQGAGKTSRHVEVRFRKTGHDGTQHGNITGVIRDVEERVWTERARAAAEDELRQSQERYRLLFDANPYATTVTDRETMRIVAANDAAEVLYGWSQEEMLALTADDFYPLEDVPAMTARRQKYRPNVPETISGLRHRKKDGTLIDVEMTARIIEYNGRLANLTIVTDVSERLRTERARQTAEEQARQSQKMEVVGQLTGGIAHDFNNLLTVILGNIEALQDGENIDPRIARRLNRVTKAVLRASDLTRSLLAFARKQPLQPQPTRLNDLVSTTGKLLRRSLGEHIELDAILADDLWSINVDRAQLESALVNLAVNARDAMPEGGRLLIETKNIALDKEDIARNPDAVVGEYVLLAVSDSGHGIPPDVLEHVFEPFFTTKETGKGSGLGLSMVYGFIRQSNGHIDVESQVGRGTSFKLYLPRSEDGQEKMAVEQKIHIVGGAERVLVVEDEPQVRASVVEQLESLGYAVNQASDGAAGKAAFEVASLPYDLLLTDIIMPGPMSGKALAGEVVRRWPTTKIVFMSGYTDGDFTQAVLPVSSALLLNKPFRKADLAKIVRQALDRPGNPDLGVL